MSPNKQSPNSNPNIINPNESINIMDSNKLCEADEKVLVFFDSGTSNSRIFVLTKDLQILYFNKVGIGSKDSAISGSNTILLEALKKLYDQALRKLELSDIDVLEIYASGMVSSPYGIHEVPHLHCPLSFKEFSEGFVSYLEDRFFKRTIFIIPGLRMDMEDISISGNSRGEEIEAIGAVSELSKLGLNSEVIILFPGSHTHAIHIKDDVLDGISSNFTGELFFALEESTILKPILNIHEPSLCQEMIDLALKNLEKFGFNRALYICHAMNIMNQFTKQERYSYAEGVINGGLKKCIDWCLENLWPNCRTLVIAGDDFSKKLLTMIFNSSNHIDRIIPLSCPINSSFAVEGLKNLIRIQRGETIHG